MALELLLALGLALADDTGIPRPQPAEPEVVWTPGVAPEPLPDWPPTELGLVTLPDDPGMRVRSTAPTVESANTTDVQVRVRYAWPVWAEKGYIPIRMSLEGRTGHRALLNTTFMVSYGSAEREVWREDELGPGEARDLDMLLPVFHPSMGGWAARFRSGEGGGGPLIYSLGASQWVSGDTQSALVVGRSAPPLGTLERWSRATPGVLVSFVAVEDLPQGAAMAGAYTSLDVVALDVTGGLPDASRLAPMLAWVRLGGTLLLAGPEQPWPAELASWMEERFEFPGMLGDHARAWSMGLGLVATVPDGDWASPVQAGALYTTASLAPSFSLVPDPERTGRVPSLIATLAGVGDLPTGALGLLLLGLAVAMGPLNLLAVRSMKRPVLLLVTTPVLAVGSSLMLVAWGLTRDGLDVQWSSSSVTLLDQRVRLASGVEKRITFAGRGQLNGLRPGAGTLLFPDSAADPASFNLDLRDGAEWTGAGMLPARQKATHVVLTDHETSRRLDVSPFLGSPNDGVEVQNHLGATVTALVLRLPSGDTFTTDVPIADGRSARLDHWVSPALLADFMASRSTPPCVKTPAGDVERFCKDVVNGSYIAWIDGQPFRDDMGVSAHDVGGEAVVIGVMAGTP